MKKTKRIVSAVVGIVVFLVSLVFINDEDAYAANSSYYYGGVDYEAVFDYNYYYNMYPDLQSAIGNNKTKLFEHFVKYGMNEGRVGRQCFNPKYYKARYGDLQKAYGNDYVKYYRHYIKYGKNEGRMGANSAVYYSTDYSSIYNADYYYSNNKDLQKAYGYDTEKLLVHFVKYGMKEGRQGKSTFDAKYYKFKYSDLQRAYENNMKSYYMHYMKYGKNENRKGRSNDFYDGVDYSGVYNFDYYYNNNVDLQRAYGYDWEKLIQHFIKYGMTEGRQGSLEFNYTYYKNKYKDLQKAYGDDKKSYYNHYMKYGKKEGRQGNVETNYNGWNVVGGNKVYYQNGQFLKGWQNIKGRKYYFSDTGALKSKTGIDVSQYQGKIDWEQVKKDGVEFAIIRLGYGMNLEKQDDAYAIYNMTECERLNIPYGVYMFSYATEVGGTKGVVSEIAHTLRLLQGRNPSVGVYIDVEQDSYKNANPVPSGATVSSICLKFNKQLTAAGYKTGTYTNTYFYDKMVTNDELDNYIKWVAEYSDSCTYRKPYLMWQYSSKGSVAGIGGNVDMNVMLLN